MNKRTYIIGLCLLILLAGANAAFSMFTWVHVSDAQRGAIQQFFTVFTGLLTIFLIMLATWAAFLSAEASKRQAIAADRQAKAADAQAEAALAQIGLSKAQLKEQVRPALILEREFANRRWDDPSQEYSAKNIGSGAAHQLLFTFETTGTDTVEEFPDEMVMVFADDWTASRLEKLKTNDPQTH